jgi:hypothetical protein
MQSRRTDCSICFTHAYIQGVATRRTYPAVKVQLIPVRHVAARQNKVYSTHVLEGINGNRSHRPLARHLRPCRNALGRRQPPRWMDHPMINVHGVELLAEVRRQDLDRETAMARLAAQVRGPEYRVQVARSLRAFARWIEPGGQGLHALRSGEA